MITYLQEGDANTKFFHPRVNSKGQKKSHSEAEARMGGVSRQEGATHS
jgi:hypothetical protein